MGSSASRYGILEDCKSMSCACKKHRKQQRHNSDNQDVLSCSIRTQQIDNRRWEPENRNFDQVQKQEQEQEQ